jgi:3-phenylpropionate/cinnamic acid dioxygenase small subunit
MNIQKMMLRSEHSVMLSSLPMTGHNYQEVDITMNDGSVFKNRIVINYELLCIRPKESIDVMQIKEFKPSKVSR